MPQPAHDVPSTHNQNVDADAMVAVTLSKMRAAQEKHASTNGELRNIFAQADKRGIHLAAAKRALKIIKSDSREELVEEVKQTLYYLRILGQPVLKAQLDLFESDSGLAPLDEKAAGDGRRAGLMGDPEANPHDLNTEAGRAWLNAYRQGRAEREIVMAMGDDDDEPEGNQAEEGEDEE